MSEQVDGFEAAFGVEQQGSAEVVDTALPEDTVVDEATPVEQEPAEVSAEAPAEEGVQADPAPVEDAPVEVEAAAPAPEQPQQMPQIDPKYLAQAIAEEQERRQREAQAAQQPAPEPEKEPSYQDFLTDAEKEAVRLMDTEWSEVAAPVHALIRANVQAALANQRKQIEAEFKQRLAPIEQVTAQSQEALYWSTIQSAHPDFREVAGQMPGWIETLPQTTALERAMRAEAARIYQSGNAAEVIELIGTYKKAIGSTGAAPAQPASSAAQVQPRAVPQEALAATLAPPTAQRSKMAASRDPNDADAAFAEAFGS